MSLILLREFFALRDKPPVGTPPAQITVLTTSGRRRTRRHNKRSPRAAQTAGGVTRGAISDARKND